MREPCPHFCIGASSRTICIDASTPPSFLHRASTCTTSTDASSCTTHTVRVLCIGASTPHPFLYRCEYPTLVSAPVRVPCPHFCTSASTLPPFPLHRHHSHRCEYPPPFLHRCESLHQSHRSEYPFPISAPVRVPAPLLDPFFEPDF